MTNVVPGCEPLAAVSFCARSGSHCSSTRARSRRHLEKEPQLPEAPGMAPWELVIGFQRKGFRRLHHRLHVLPNAVSSPGKYPWGLARCAPMGSVAFSTDTRLHSAHQPGNRPPPHAIFNQPFRRPPAQEGATPRRCLRPAPFLPCNFAQRSRTTGRANNAKGQAIGFPQGSFSPVASLFDNICSRHMPVKLIGQRLAF